MFAFLNTECVIPIYFLFTLLLLSGSLLSRREAAGLQPQGPGVTISSTSGNSGQEAAVGLNPNTSTQDSEVRTIPLRTMIAAVPASGEHGSDSPHGSVGMVYPVLARVQNVTSGNSNGIRASQESEQHRGQDADTEQQTMSGSATQQQNIGVPGRNGERTYDWTLLTPFTITILSFLLTNHNYYL